MTRLLLALIILICFASCSKKSSSPSNLVGKWLETEYKYDTAIAWITTTEINSSKIEFKSDGTYQMTPPLYVSALYCPGNYRVVNDSTLVWGWSCSGTPVETTNLFSKEGDKLIIFYKGIRNYRMKFKKVYKF